MKTAKDITLQEFLDNLDYIQFDEDEHRYDMSSGYVHIKAIDVGGELQCDVAYDRREYLKKELERIKNDMMSHKFDEDALFQSLVSLQGRLNKYIEDLDEYCEGR